MSFIAAAVIGGGALIGGVLSSNASKDAASDQENAANNANATQLQMFNKTQANFAPQVALGQNASGMLAGLYGLGGKAPNASGFYETPGYTFSLGQGEGAINKAAAANGSLYSSNTLGALNNYAQGTASTQYNSYINQLLSMAGLGNAASSGVGAAATATGTGIASNTIGAGNAAANGVLGSSNAFTNALGSVANNSNLLGSLNGGGNASTGISFDASNPGVSTPVFSGPSPDSVGF